MKYVNTVWLVLVLMTALVWVPTVASACAVCGGDPESPMTAGMNAGIISLLIVIGMVLSMFATFFLFLRQRHRKLKSLSVDEQWLDGMRRMTNA